MNHRQRRIHLLLLLLIELLSAVAVAAPAPPPLDSMVLVTEEDILQQELEWAEQAMEGYKRKTGKLPIRSSIRAAHVHTEAWRQDSIDVVQGRSSTKEWELLDFPNSSQKLRGGASY